MDIRVSQPVIYRRRRGATSRGEREWRVEPDALVMHGASGAERRLPWAEIVGVRLYKEALGRRPFRYAFELQPKHRRKITLDNAHFISPGVYEDRSAAYVAFVRAALAAIARENPKARALMAETPKRYFLLLLLVLLALGVGALGLALWPTPVSWGVMGSPVKMALMAGVLALSWALVLRVMPRGVRLDAIPPHVLPEDERAE